MTAPVVHVRDQPTLGTVPTYIGFCCREWVLAVGQHGTCGLCGQIPTFLRPDTDGNG